MKTALSILVFLALGSSASMAASVVNHDKEQRTLVVTEGARQTQLVVGAGETVEFCAAGCFVTMPNGDREVLKGSETVDITNGIGRIK